MKKRTEGFFKTAFLFTAVAALSFSLAGCYSVFSGGTGGSVVDAESTSTPKEGIANVDVYAYTDEDDRNSDYNKWKSGTVFKPSASYYGHTSTGTNGDFSLSKIVWKSYSPEFGKDADVSTIYLLFYHEDYGLTKGKTVIVSDSTCDTVYQELTAIRKTTLLTLNFIDVASQQNTSNPVYVKVSVPQTTESETDAKAKVYEATLTGSGSISISYPRWQNKNDRKDGIETKPEVKITYSHSSDTVEWKACYNEDGPDKDYAFLEDDFELSRTISSSAYTVNLYGKATKLSVPVFSGQLIENSSSQDDGKVISLKIDSDGDGDYELDCGETTTYSQTIGTSAAEKHGVFSGLGSGNYWTDSTYTGRYAEVSAKIFVEGNEKLTKDIRSSTPSYNVVIN